MYCGSRAGGPRIVFTRNAKCNETYIRGNPNKPVKVIMDRDINNMYGYCSAQEMPIGIYVQYRCERVFRAEPHTKCMDMYFWMNYVSETEGVYIAHKLHSEMHEICVRNFFAMVSACVANR